MKIKESWFYIVMFIVCICAIVAAAHDENLPEILWIIVTALWVTVSWMKSSEAKYWEEQYHKSDEFAGRCIKNAEDALKIADKTQEKNKDLLEDMHFYSDNLLKAMNEIERLDPEDNQVNQVLAGIRQAMYMREKEREKKMADDKD